MARTCTLCRRGTTRDASRSHSNIKTLTKQYINLQTATIDGVKMKVCTKCIKTRKKEKKSA